MQRLYEQALSKRPPPDSRTGHSALMTYPKTGTPDDGNTIPGNRRCHRRRWALRPASWSFNANDPSGGGRHQPPTSTAIASVGAHALPVVTGAYVRDTAEIVRPLSRFDDEAVTEQARSHPGRRARTGLQGRFCRQRRRTSVPSPRWHPTTPMSAGGLHARPILVARRQDRPVPGRLHRAAVAPDDSVGRKPQHAIAAGCCPTGSPNAAPSARDIAERSQRVRRALHAWSPACPCPTSSSTTFCASPTAVLCSEKFERFEAVFTGAGDTLSARIGGADRQRHRAHTKP